MLRRFVCSAAGWCVERQEAWRRLRVDRGLLLCTRHDKCVCVRPWHLQQEAVTERQDAPTSLHSQHFHTGSSRQGDSSEQGEPDRNNTINQTRLSLRSLFLLGHIFAS